MTPSEDQITEVAEVFRLLGDPTRLKVVFACLDEPVSVGNIASSVGASVSLVSHHLRLLKGARMVRSHRNGRQIFYMAADQHVRSILTGMVEHANETTAETAGGT